jgi:hypothetical protein
VKAEDVAQDVAVAGHQALGVVHVAGGETGQQAGLVGGVKDGGGRRGASPQRALFKWRYRKRPGTLILRLPAQFSAGSLPISANTFQPLVVGMCPIA